LTEKQEKPAPLKSGRFCGNWRLAYRFRNLHSALSGVLQIGYFDFALLAPSRYSPKSASLQGFRQHAASSRIQAYQFGRMLHQLSHKREFISREYLLVLKPFYNRRLSPQAEFIWQRTSALEAR
jgi:hypothetical protein